MPSAFIPVCALAMNLKTLGMKVNNFYYYICNKFQPTILDGSLCYKLDLTELGHKTQEGPQNGLWLVLDYNDERSMRNGKNNNITINYDGEKVPAKQEMQNEAKI